MNEEVELKKFDCIARVTISVYTEVEAKTADEAKRIAEDRNLMHVIHTGGENKNEFWMCDELDGEPEEIQVLEME